MALKAPCNMSTCQDTESNETEEDEETYKVNSLCADLSCLCVYLCVPKEAKPKEQVDQIISSIIGE
jgi:hypothetical protein